MTSLDPRETGPDAAIERSRRFLDLMKTRRTVRRFSDRPVPEELIRNVIATAGTAPSGANKQPWRFVAVSDPALKQEIRDAAEQEERDFYERRANHAWLEDLGPLGTNAEKPFIEEAPWLIVVFKLMKDNFDNERSNQVYYVNESVGIAVGMLIAAAHQAGLSTLTHTPSPMSFLCKILDRPAHERPFLLIPIGYPLDSYVPPKVERKSLSDIMVNNRNDPVDP